MWKCKYCGSTDFGEYFNEELDYVTFRCNNCFHEEDNEDDLVEYVEE